MGYNMSKLVKCFLMRGMAFGGFGPIIAGIIYLTLSYTIDNFTLSGAEVFLGVISTYLLAFVQAGASVFNQIESWSIGKSLLVHLSVIYIAYVSCYLVNTWIPFEWAAILIFTGIFVTSYLIIWLTVYIVVRGVSKRLNEKIKK